MKDFKKSKFLYISIGVIIITICIIVCFFIEHNDTNNEIIELDSNITQTKEDILPKENESKIFIHIDGEVCNPGVIELDEGSRIKDVIEKAGGLTNEADTSDVNFAYQVEDGQKIKIPNIHEKEQKDSNQQGSLIVQNEDGGVVVEGKINPKININTATQSELETLNGIGPSMAAKIITYRKSNGAFKKIEDIKNVPGIGNSKFEGIKENICVK